MDLNEKQPNGKYLKQLPEEMEEMFASIKAVKGPIHHAAVHFLFNQQNCHIMWDNAATVGEETRGALRAISQASCEEFLLFATSIVFAEQKPEKVADLALMMEFIEGIKKDVDLLMKKQAEYNVE